MKIKISCLIPICLMLLTCLPMIQCSNEENTTPTGKGAIPKGLPNEFMLGVANSPEQYVSFSGLSAPLDLRSYVLQGGLNAENNGWEKQDESLPASYASLTWTAKAIPIFTYYEMLQSSRTGIQIWEKYYNFLNSDSQMQKFFTNFILLLQKLNNDSNIAIINVEPELWGLMHTHYLDNVDSMASISAAVSSSGHSEIPSSVPNHLDGFIMALKLLRDKYASNVLLGAAISHDSLDVDLGTDTGTADVTAHAQRVGSFFMNSNAPDLLFYNPAKRDAGYYETVDKDNGAHWWDTSDAQAPNFQRITQWLDTITTLTQLRVIWWRVPIGNQYYSTCNNTPHHYMDNKVEYFLDDPEHISDIAQAGSIGMVLGPYFDCDTCTDWLDTANDGVTNGTGSIPGNEGTLSELTDDDGGYLRSLIPTYYQNPVLLP